MLFSILFLIFTTYFVYKAHKNTKDVKINTVKIPARTELKQIGSFSILHLSDLHMENISLTPEQLAKNLENKQVDMIALTGDFLDRKRSIPKLIPYLQVLNNVQPQYGIYAVLGNHDYVLKGIYLQQLIDVLTVHNCKVLRNDSDMFTVNGVSTHVIGIDDYSTNRSNVSLAYKRVKEGINIVLTHDPTVVLEMDNYPFDYLMAGHFHGGQICYPKAYHLVKMGKLARKQIIKGFHMYKNNPFYISEGLGQTGVNIRIGSRPEITFHDLPIQFKAN